MPCRKTQTSTPPCLARLRRGTRRSCFPTVLREESRIRHIDVRTYVPRNRIFCGGNPWVASTFQRRGYGGGKVPLRWCRGGVLVALARRDATWAHRSDRLGTLAPTSCSRGQ